MCTAMVNVPVAVSCDCDCANINRGALPLPTAAGVRQRGGGSTTPSRGHQRGAGDVGVRQPHAFEGASAGGRGCWYGAAVGAGRPTIYRLQ